MFSKLVPIRSQARDEPPKKYINTNGVMKLNPQYKKWKEREQLRNGGAGAGGAFVPVTTVQKPKHALPVVSNLEDHDKLNHDLGKEIPLSESTTATIEMMQEPEISNAAGMQPDEMMDKLGIVLAKYEIPLGLVNKLMMLSEYKILEFMVDDSGSMLRETDTVDPMTERPLSRWEEAHRRLLEMVEILAYVPFNRIDVVFLNRADHIILERKGRDPVTFLQGAKAEIDSSFEKRPSGTTPALERIRESINAGENDSVARYFFGDGVPNGGRNAQIEISNLLRNRQDPSRNPMTFISCTNEDDQVEWMKEAEEVVPYCSESDDFNDEAREVLRDQGSALPYTKGFHLISQLVAAMNPEDLDAMDESVPFTKTTLDNLLGLQHNEETYRHYFQKFQEAQRKRFVESKMDQAKKRVKWKLEDFMHVALSKDIPQVQEFKKELQQLAQHATRMPY